MPFRIRKVKNKPLYSVKNAKTGAVYSKGTSKPKAEAQVRLLSRLEANR